MPFVLLQTLSLGILAALLFLAPPLRRLGETTEAARTQFVVSMADTQGTLTTLARNIADDSAFTSHLRWQMHNSASTLVNGQLRLGELDEVQVLGANCQRYLRASLKNNITFDCQQSGVLASTKDRFLWFDDAGAPLLGVAINIKKVDRPTTMIGFVRLDSDWLALHPNLAKYFGPLELKIVPSNETLAPRSVLVKTNQSNKTGGASLVTGRGVLAWIPAPLLKSDLTASPAIWLLLLITAALTLSIWSRAHVILRQSTDKFDEFLTWCRQVRLYAKEMSIGQQPQPMPKPSLRGPLETAQQEVLAAVNELNDGLLLQQREITAGEQRVVHLEQQIQSAQLDASNVARLKSLALQTESFAKVLQQDIGDFRDRLQDLSDITTHGMHPEAQKIAVLISDWQAQIEARGSRKFIRSMAETNITPTVTLLDQQLEFLRTTASHLLDAILAMSQQKNQLHDRLQDLQAVTTFWANFDANDKGEPVHSLPHAVNNAQRLAAMQLKSLANVRFENQLESAAPLALPDIPDSALVSSLFHMYVSAAYKLLDEPSNNSTITMSTQVRMGRDQQMLIISATIVPRVGNSKYTGDHDMMNKHLSFARNIAAGYGLQARVLPVVGNCQPYALTWESGSVPRELKIPAALSAESTTI